MTHSNTIKGFTVLELNIVLILLGLLLFMIIPNLKIFLTRQEREITLDQLSTAISFAQNEAFQRQKIISLCASQYIEEPFENKFYCHSNKDWSEGFMIFENEIAQKQDSVPSNKIIKRFPGLVHGKLQFNSGKGHQQLHIHPNGMTMTMDIGYFIYSPETVRLNLESEKLICSRACHCRREIVPN